MAAQYTRPALAGTIDFPPQKKQMMNIPRDHKSESIREFNRSADDYDTQSPFYYRMTRLCDDAVIARISSLQKPTLRILDVGCGTGALLEKVRHAFPDAVLHGIDISPNMLAVARSKNLRDVVLDEGDAENLPYANRSFDIITCCSSFHHYPNPQKALAEFQRVARPAGTLIICDMDLPDAARLIANHILFPLQKKGDVHVYTHWEIKQLLINQGWKYCRVNRITPVEWIAIGTAPIHAPTS